MSNTIFDICILKGLGVKYRCAKALKIIHVIWYAPYLGWIKVNNDGAALAFLDVPVMDRFLELAKVSSSAAFDPFFR